MGEECQGCKHKINGNYCANCGQRIYKRIDKNYVLDEIQFTVFRTNKGFLYSIISLIQNPGKTAREFINGNRAKHYKPLPLMVLLSAFSVFISIKLMGLNNVFEAYTASQPNSIVTNSFYSFLFSNFSLLMILAIPIISLITKLVFKKWEQNYYEHIVMNTYIISFHTIVSIIILTPITLFFIHKYDPETVIRFLNYSNILLPLILVWFYKGFYPDKPLISIIGKAIVVFILTYLIFITTLILGLIVSVIYTAITDPDALKQMFPL